MKKIRGSILAELPFYPGSALGRPNLSSSSLFVWLWIIMLLLCARHIQPGYAGVPPRKYLITIHYDLGMHCTGFDFSYCCILPPYNSILAQLIETAADSLSKPRILTESDLRQDSLLLWYWHEHNTYSEGAKMLYWNVPADVTGDGRINDPRDSFANRFWNHLFTFQESLFEFRPYPTGQLTPLFLGRDLPISEDHGLTGHPMSFGHLSYTGSQGTVLYTRTNDGVTEVPLVLSMRGYWEALGLPLTPFLDGSMGSVRQAREEQIRPFQKAVVSLVRWQDGNRDRIPQPGEVSPVVDPRAGEVVQFFGTNPVDVPGCERCHASPRANGEQFRLWEKEYRFWRNYFPGTTEYYARIKAASISLLEIHDQHHGTSFLKNYRPQDRTGASVTRLGREPIRCQSCHADNIVGMLRSERAQPSQIPVSSLSQAIHLSHLRSVPEGDERGRPVICQGCHPAHQQNGSLANLPLTSDGRFRGGDIRDYTGGCFLGRDVHARSDRYPRRLSRSYLNAVGRWLQKRLQSEGRGMYCTHCHNLGSRLLYKADTLRNVLTLDGKTLRNRSLKDIVQALQKMENGHYAHFEIQDFFDPRMGEKGAVAAVWTDPPADPYGVVDDGGDFWLSAGEPHCADCHLPPFVESMGGSYQPIDQPEKFSLMRYSKGHRGISCQSCHQSTHGLYPVLPAGSDPVSLGQASLLNPDGSSGPLTCAACHAVDQQGIPYLLQPDMIAAFPDALYPTRYDKAVAYMHSARSYQEIRGVGK